MINGRQCSVFKKLMFRDRRQFHLINMILYLYLLKSGGNLDSMDDIHWLFACVCMVKP